MSSTHRFGCEFEFSTEWNKMAKLIPEAVHKYSKDKIYIPKGNQRKLYDSYNNKKWHLKVDGSTETEVNTPVSTLRDLPKICRVISSLVQFPLPQG